MNAPPFPANPSFGQYYGNWVWSGSRWVCTNTNGVRIVTQVFRASAPYTPSPGLITAVVECIGGGGGGGGADSGNATTVVSGGGGGSGGYSRVTLASGLVLGGVNVTIGAGGASQAAGGATSFGALCVANGGGGGFGNDASTEWGWGGPGGAPGIGDVAFPGAGGQPGAIGPETSVVQQPMGGWIFGGTSTGQTVGGAVNGGLAGAPNTGAGGSGAANNALAQVAVAGGAGGSGLCIVTEYCWADTVDDGCGCGPTGQARVAIGGQGWQGGFDD
jgi:hypothetical protein